MARTGRLTTVLADDATAPCQRIGESLPGVAIALLKQLDLLSCVAVEGRIACVGNASSWGSDDVSYTDFIRDPNGHGWHLDRGRFDQDLRDAACAAGAVRRTGRVRRAWMDADGWQAEFDDGIVRARWLVDASGRAGAVARWLNVPREQDEPMLALHAWGTDRSSDRRSLVEATPEGWWYTAGLPRGRRVAALHVKPAGAARILRDGAWRRLLARTRHLSEVCHVDDSWTRPAGTDAGGAWMPIPCGPRWIAVGDAALALDPLSSQGMFNSLYTGWRGAQALAAVAQGEGTEKLLDYARRLHEIRAVYRSNLHAYYGMERRWPDQPFWHDRQAGMLPEASV
ncbi:hypothetical protein ASB57_19085 [Bordetella sp. N]|nr:hypothetical protein ASB57_19085 [Bordetella sp. N]